MVGSSRKALERHLDIERAADPRQELNGQERVAPALEEIVMSTDRFAAKELGPDIGEGFFDRPSRRDEVGSGRERCLSGVGEGLAVDLAVGCQRKSVRGPRTPRGPCTRESSQEPSSQFGRDGSDPGRSRSTMYATKLISPLGSGRAATAASRTAGCRASAASISPSSTRNPRILTW